LSATGQERLPELSSDRAQIARKWIALAGRSASSVASLASRLSRIGLLHSPFAEQYFSGVGKSCLVVHVLTNVLNFR
jgi:hypothetical protein